ncbi:MAG: hypothetical protein WDW38_006033 [Sanguina aurantia]
MTVEVPHDAATTARAAVHTTQVRRSNSTVGECDADLYPCEQDQDRDGGKSKVTGSAGWFRKAAGCVWGNGPWIARLALALALLITCVVIGAQQREVLSLNGCVRGLKGEVAQLEERLRQEDQRVTTHLRNHHHHHHPQPQQDDEPHLAGTSDPRSSVAQAIGPITAAGAAAAAAAAAAATAAQGRQQLQQLEDKRDGAEGKRVGSDDGSRSDGWEDRILLEGSNSDGLDGGAGGEGVGSSSSSGGAGGSSKQARKLRRTTERLAAQVRRARQEQAALDREVMLGTRRLQSAQAENSAKHQLLKDAEQKLKELQANAFAVNTGSAVERSDRRRAVSPPPSKPG